MKLFLMIGWALLMKLPGYTQDTDEPSPATQEQWEDEATVSEAPPPEDDSYWQQREYLLRHRLNLNDADRASLESLHMLTPLQIDHFLQYRRLLGKLIDRYELQAIPSWDIASIQKLLPFITVTNRQPLPASVWKRLRGGEQSFLARYTLVPEKSKGFTDTAGNHYTGSRYGLLERCRYNYKNCLQWGITGDKDAGEPFFRGAQKAGFDFYSFHLFARRLGAIRSLALGDFTVNLGQGLIQWQGPAFTRSSDATAIKRQSPVLCPYNSAGEFNFYRGAGITLQRKAWQMTLFASCRRLNAHLSTDSLDGKGSFVSSLLPSGYDRTPTEIAERRRLFSVAAGGNLQYGNDRWHAGFNVVHYRFAFPFETSGKPYDLFGISGRNWENYSVDYSYTFHNIHGFGEIAIDRRGDFAGVGGWLASLGRGVDLTLLYRSIDKAYQSLFSNAFTENTKPTNEKGLYMGIAVVLSKCFRVDAYADLFRFPWLRYRDDAPGYGSAYMIRLSCTPDKQVEINSRYTFRARSMNLDEAGSIMAPTGWRPLQNWRTQVSFRLNKVWKFRHRIELSWFDKNNLPQRQNGYLVYTDVLFKAPAGHLAGGVRLQYFETDNYDSRIYAYENDVLYGFSVPAFFDRGFRYYINLKLTPNRLLVHRFLGAKSLNMWIRWGQMIYPDRDSIGSGLDTIKGHRKSSLKFQFICHW